MMIRQERRARDVLGSIDRPAAAGRIASMAPGVLVAAALAVAGCASTAVMEMPPPTYEQKIGWIVRLENERVLADPPPPPVEPASGQAAARPPLLRPDLLMLLRDPDVQIRRRAALAIGRVGLSAGVPGLVEALADAEPEVRQMAAFGLGLIGDRAAAEPLMAALADESPVVRGRAAEALGLLRHVAAAPAIGDLVLRLARGGAVTQVAADDLGHPLSPEIEAFRLGVVALARLRAYDELAAGVIAENGEPLVRWWPVAFALQHIADPRSVPALITLARSGGPGAVFAAQGLGAVGGPESVAELRTIADDPRTPVPLAIAAVEGLAASGAIESVSRLAELIRGRETPPLLRVAAIRAAGRLRAQEVTDYLLDLASAPSPTTRAAALDALASLDPLMFVTVLSGIDADRHWSVRASLARTLGRLPAEIGLPRLRQMLGDDDQRVVPAVLESLVELRAPDIDAILREHLASSDPVVRMAAARGIGDLRLPDGVPALTSAYDAGRADPSYVARAAALTALAEYGTPEAVATLRRGLLDADWGVRRQAATLLRELEVAPDGSDDYAALIRPAPTGRDPITYESAILVRPQISPHIFLDTAEGTIQIEVAVLDAPMTVENFMHLARQGYFDGLPLHRVLPEVVQGGDRRGDGAGGPGYTIRDEINQVPFLRGTLGMSRDWEDTGGSQFFITRLPQPLLDGRFTAFGRVIAGLEVLDALEPWDVVERVRVWDGT